MRFGLPVLLALAGCIEPNLVRCDNGLACSDGQVCDEVHASCVLPDQLTVCDGRAQDEDCTAGPVTGGCFDGVCVARGCGNRILEPTEACDDGNQASGDGCRSDCQSDERCTNGVVDLPTGEQCDDGNARSHDGCDSRCQREMEGWSVVPMAPHCVSNVYDPVRRVFVCVTVSSTWELSGAHWSLVEDKQPPAELTMYFDTDEHQVGAIDRTGARFVWAQSTWTSAGPAIGTGVVAMGVLYDPARHTPVAITSDGHLWTLDAQGAWQGEVATLDLSSPNLDYAGFRWIGFDGTYDAANARLVLGGHWYADYDSTCSDACPSFDGYMNWLPSNQQWTRNDNGLPHGIYDSVHDRVLSVSRTGVFELSANGTWTSVGPGSNADVGDLGFDPVTATVLSPFPWHVVEWSTTWSTRRLDTPSSPMLTADPRTGGFVAYDLLAYNNTFYYPSPPAGVIESRTWTWNGQWQLDPDPPASGPRSKPFLVYDAERRLPLLFGGFEGLVWRGDTYALTGAGWTQLVATPLPSSVTGAGFDPALPGVLAFAGGVKTLPSTASAWTSDPTSFVDSLTSFAFDPTSNQMFATTSTGFLYERTNDTWARALISPTTPGYQLLTDERRGIAMMVPIDGTHTRVFEHRSGGWIEASPLPEPIRGTAAYEPMQGRIMIVGEGSHGYTIALVRTIESGGPNERCATYEDADGDGLAGCEDPDCGPLCGP